MNLASDVMKQAREFFALPEESKMEVSSELIPDEYCGYHGMQRYNPNGWKYRGVLLVPHCTTSQRPLIH
jgi:isopenicillin N synthase-like dioxygenase